MKTKLIKDDENITNPINSRSFPLMEEVMTYWCDGFGISILGQIIIVILTEKDGSQY